MKKTQLYTTDIFNGKPFPPFLKGHALFTTPTKVGKKAFSSLGLENFSEEVDVPRVATDIKREGSFVWNLLQDIHSESTKARDALRLAHESIWLASAEERALRKAKSHEVAVIIAGLQALSDSCDPRATATVWSGENPTVTTRDGRIELILQKDVKDPAGNYLYKKPYPIVRLYARLREKCLEHGVPANTFRAIETLDSFKVFGQENVPDRKYRLVFSADGQEGVWDIATMSMRGTRSCQRWEGEYPRCLIGSMLSKFVGVMYLTSGAPAESHDGYGSMGTKMMRRCVVRFAIDSQTKEPVLVLDRMYPGDEEHIIQLFTKTLKDKAIYKDPKTGEKKKIQVLYGYRLTSQLKQLYVPDEPLLLTIPYKERSYQDTSIQTKGDMRAVALSKYKTEPARHLTIVMGNFSAFLAQSLAELLRSHPKSKDETYVKETMKLMTNSFTIGQLGDNFSQYILKDSYRGVMALDYHDPKSYSNAYFRHIIIHRKKLMASARSSLDSLFTNYLPGSHVYESMTIVTYISRMLAAFIRSEISRNLRGV